MNPPNPLPPNRLVPFHKRMMDLIEQTPTKGQILFFISVEWFVAFSAYCLSRGKEPHPGPIDNTELYDTNGEEKNHLEGIAFGVPDLAWDAIFHR